MPSPSQAHYADLLAKISGTAFQDEVAALYLKNGIPFQPVPAKPSGDGGLDGTSHNQTVGYCCYGLELAGSPSTPAKRAAAIVDKFKTDLRRILELEQKGKALLHADNDALAAIMAPGVRLTCATLVCNWFETNTILGPLNKAFAEYKKASKCRFVSPDCQLVVLGPKQLADMFGVDELLLLRLEQKGLVEILESSASAATPSDISGFDEKFERLLIAFPGEENAIKALRDDFMRLWCQHLQKMEDLNNALPSIHKQVHKLVVAAATSASLKSLTATAHGANQMIEEVTEKLSGDFTGTLPETYVWQFAAGVVASLIGDCPLRWRA